jgi:hypothetical protein
MNYLALRAFGLMLLMLSLGALSCDLADLTGGGKPTVVITSPPSGSQFQEGQDVAVQSTSSDAKGIVRVELVVDGITVRTDTLPNPQPQFAVIQTWKANQGPHTLTVRAYNTANEQSDPVSISVAVSPSVALGGTPTTTGGTPGAVTPGPGGCSNDSVFIADVTIPSGATVGGGQLFNKIWRVRNAGTCPWGTGYDFTFVSGEAMAATTTIAVPNTDPGITADLLIAMTAPASTGTHSGQWRLRANGVPFGATLNVSISVPPSAPPCPGPPVIASFSASPNPITAGQSTTLSWGQVSNATSAVIDQGVGGVATPGNRSVSPPSTRTYTLTATGCGGVATSQVVVTVNPAPSNTATPTPTLAPVANFGGHWDTNFGPMDLGQVGNAVTGSYSHYGGGCAGGTINGTVTGNTLNGNWGGCGAGSIHFVLAGAGNRWDGNYAGTNKWCAARSGVGLAAGCGFSGHWNLRTGTSIEVADLTQTGNSVSGTYTKGTVNGTVTGWTLHGTWHIGSNNGPFSWFIAPSNLSFQGNYGGTQWCGWRDGPPVIASGANCLQ